jgi:hypothetical protein
MASNDISLIATIRLIKLLAKTTGQSVVTMSSQLESACFMTFPGS